MPAELTVVPAGCIIEYEGLEQLSILLEDGRRGAVCRDANGLGFRYYVSACKKCHWSPGGPFPIERSSRADYCAKCSTNMSQSVSADRAQEIARKVAG